MKTIGWFNPRLVAILLFVGAAVYAVGALAEASVTSRPATTTRAVMTPPAPASGETGNESTEHPSTSRTSVSSEAVGGFNPEAPIIVAATVIVFLVLGAAMWLRPGRGLLIAVAVTALVATVLDLREIGHQAAEGRGLLVGIAAVLVVVHLATAGASGGALRTSKETAS